MTSIENYYRHQLMSGNSVPNQRRDTLLHGDQIDFVEKQEQDITGERLEQNNRSRKKYLFEKIIRIAKHPFRSRKK
ncbi:unnamed protein product [Thelazia callipaeda]|uniref:Uncharacterized protein n=1 Tax=Thelazia callipaeda TaxID=103827 RepID=A0A0N5CZR7_THECL|nr:unnamed protein product [Thelazia callipaeda]